MDILKKDNYSFIQLVLLAFFLGWKLTTLSFADNSAVLKAFDKAYRVGHCDEPNDIQEIAVNLQSVLRGCNDGNESSRIRYELGMLYFKAHKAEQAKEQFMTIANKEDGTYLIHICSLNMAGQISRMAGQDADALATFGQLVQLVEKSQKVEGGPSISAIVFRLMCLGLFARAEIFEHQKDYRSAISEYGYLLSCLEKDGEGKCKWYIPLAKDRMSQSYLIDGETERYFKVAKAIVEQHPEYYRSPLIKFETEAIRFLKSVRADSKFSNGSFTTPVELITYFKNTKDIASFEAISGKLDSLCKKYKNTYAGILLNYHYAWLLDAMGEKDKATELFAQIAASGDQKKAYPFQAKTVIDTVLSYARVQCAIMYGETGNYNQSLKFLSDLQVHDGNVHLSNLAQSVENSLETLRREVPKKDDNK